MFPSRQIYLNKFIGSFITYLYTSHNVRYAPVVWHTHAHTHTHIITTTAKQNTFTPLADQNYGDIRYVRAAGRYPQSSDCS